jgi:DNA polymerase-3 subunit epsilon
MGRAQDRWRASQGRDVGASTYREAMPPASPLSRPPAGPLAGPPSRPSSQLRFDDLGTPLDQVTFVVVDLETTGGSSDDEITEIGAVKVRGGEVLGELSTLVRPGRSIPPMISVLTGITDAMVHDAPTIEAALPSLLEFLAGAVVVAHNAPFDVGFLARACAAQGLTWPRPSVVDTVRLARAIIPRDEVRNAKLSTLARHFGAPVQPTHRALDDARATVHVLHCLLERVGTLHVQSLDELIGYSRKVPDAVRRKASLADGIPDAPGVYLFKDSDGRILYVGTSRSLRARVRSYFTAAETRSRMRQMVAQAVEVTPIVCPTPLEARVRELRLIAEHRPPFNQRSRRPDRSAWLRLTDEPFPRLSIVRSPRGDDAAIGPFPGRMGAEAAMACLLDTIPLRQCTSRLSVSKPSPACVLAELGRCGAPCTGEQSRDDYTAVVDEARRAMNSDPSPIVAASFARMTTLARTGRYEQAALHRDRLRAFLDGAAWTQRARSLAACSLLVAAAPSDEQRRRWEVVVVGHGRLVASATLPADTTMRSAIEALVATAPHVDPEAHGLPAGTPEETSAVLAWLDAPQVRLAVVDGTWCSSITGAGAWGAGRRRLSSYERELRRTLDDAALSDIPPADIPPADAESEASDDGSDPVLEQLGDRPVVQRRRGPFHRGGDGLDERGRFAV